MFIIFETTSTGKCFRLSHSQCPSHWRSAPRSLFCIIWAMATIHDFRKGRRDRLWAVGLFVYDVKMLCETAIVWHGILPNNKLETHILLSWNWSCFWSFLETFQALHGRVTQLRSQGFHGFHGFLALSRPRKAGSCGCLCNRTRSPWRPK